MKRVNKEIWKELKKVGYKRGFNFLLRPTIGDVIEWLHKNGIHISLLYTNISDKWETQIQVFKQSSNRGFWVSIPSYTSWNREDYDVTLNIAIINAIKVYVEKNKK